MKIIELINQLIEQYHPDAEIRILTEHGAGLPIIRIQHNDVCVYICTDFNKELNNQKDSKVLLPRYIEERD